MNKLILLQNMKKLKELEITVNYEVRLFDLEVSNEIFDQLEEVSEINFGDNVYPELAEFLNEKVNEDESIYGFYTIDFFEEDDEENEKSKIYTLENNIIYSPDNGIYLKFTNQVSDVDKQAILDMLNDTLC